MVEGTDDQDWNQIWYVSNKINRHVCCNMSLFSKLKEKFMVEKNEEQKKFIFIHGIGEVQIKIESEIFVIPGVHYTPEITLNILSASQLEAQGLELIFKGNRCKPIPMFKEHAACFFDANRMNQRHNEYLDGYFRMLDEDSKQKEEHHKEMAVTFIHKCNICDENGHIDYMCPQYPMTAEDDDFVIVKGVHHPIPIKCFNDCIYLLTYIRDDNLNSQNWKPFRQNFIEAYSWFYSVYLKKDLPKPFPPKIYGKKIHLMDLHILVEALGGTLVLIFQINFLILLKLLA